MPVSISYNASTPLTAEELSTFVPVTLQAGSQTYTQSISIANLVANGNSLVVPFMVTFEPIDVGLKTLIATVNASQIFKESNFANNSSQQMVHVVGKYKIIKHVTVEDNTDNIPIGIGLRTLANEPTIFPNNLDFVSAEPRKLAGCKSTDNKKVKIFVK